VDTLICPGTTIELQIEYAHRQNGELGSRVSRVSINRTGLADAALAPVNRLLETFGNPPRIAALCTGRVVRLALMGADTTDRERFELVGLGGE
jgi:hypothetical protein